jgi:jumonji domain-containing protein 7
MKQLARDTAELWAPSQVQVLPTAPDSLTFLRDFVSRSTPCVVRNACEGWRAREWTLDYLSAAMSGDAVVTVDVTPDGWGDAVKPAGPNGAQWFVKPEERRMTMAEFVRLLRSNHPMHVPYLSHQNDSLRDEFTPVKQDVPPEIEWASAAFGTPPDATNIWIGDGRAVSSVHKDHYENMYQLRSHQ